jgi:hypothetical protein
VIKVAVSSSAPDSRRAPRATLFQDSTTFVNTPSAYIQRMEIGGRMEPSANLQDIFVGRGPNRKENQAPQSANSSKAKAIALHKIQGKGIIDRLNRLKRQMEDSQRGEKRPRLQVTGQSPMLEMQVRDRVPLLVSVNYFVYKVLIWCFTF